MQYHIAGNWTVFGQYNYSDYGKTNILFPTAVVLSQSRLTSSAVSICVNYKF